MASVFLRILFIHWLAFLDALRQFVQDYAPQPLLSPVFIDWRLIEDNSTIPPTAHVPRIYNSSDYIYINTSSVDLASTCLAPTIFQAALTLNLSCNVNRPDYALDVFKVGSSRNDVSLDSTVRPPAIPQEEVPETSAPTKIGANQIQTNMTPYGSRGISFCPVLVGIMYIHSLLHVYMILMIPSFFNHWFEDMLVYESLDPTDPLGYSRLHTGLLVVQWCFFRWGMHKAITSLYRRLRRIPYRPAHPPMPIPRIVLVRVDGEAVPTKFPDDQQGNVDIWKRSFRESAHSGIDNNQFITSPDRLRDLSFISGGDSCRNAAECEVSSTQAISHQGGLAALLDDIRDGLAGDSLGSEPPGDAERDANGASDHRTEIVDPTENELLQFAEREILAVTDTLAEMASVVDEQIGNVGHMEFLEEVNNDVFRDDETEGPNGDQTFSPWSFVNDLDPDESEPETVLIGLCNPANGFSGTVTKIVRFDISTDASVADESQLSSGGSYTGEQPSCPSTLGNEARENSDGPSEGAKVALDLPTNMTSQEVTQSFLSVMFSEQATEAIDILARSWSPSLIEKPIVNLPSSAVIREGVGFVDASSVIPTALDEDVATRSPLQILCSFVPSVVLNMKCVIEAEKPSLTPVGNEKLDQGTFDRTETRKDKASVHVFSEIAAPSENGAWSSHRAADALYLVYSPKAGSESNVELSSSSTILELDMPVADISPAVPATNPSLMAETYETSPGAANDPIARSVGNELQKPGPGADTGMLVEESGKEAQINLAIVEETDGVAISISGQVIDLPCGAATKVPTKRVSEEASALPCEEPKLLEKPTKEKTGRSNDGKDHETIAILWDHPGTLSKPPPARNLSCSMHAPPEPFSIPTTNEDIDRATVPYETSKLNPIVPAKTDGDEEWTSTINGKRSEHGTDLFASIHAPQKSTKSEHQSLASQLTNRDHRRSTTNSVATDEGVAAKPSPDWTAMPDVVDAFRMFKFVPTGNTVRRVSSIAECISRAPMAEVVCQKGTPTNSLNNAYATADIEGHRRHGSGLLLIRDLVSFDPADFNLRSCTNIRTSKFHGLNAITVQEVLCPGVVNMSPYSVQDGTKPRPVRMNVKSGSTGVQRQQSTLMPCMGDMEPEFGSQQWSTYRG